MNSKTLLVIVLLASIVLVGCGESGPGEVNVYQGTGSISMDTARNAPPDQVFENSVFLLGVELQNEGAFSLHPTDGNNRRGYIIVDYDSLYLDYIDGRLDSDDKTTPFYLEGRSLVYPRGERNVINLGSFEVPEITRGLGQPSTTIKLDACYPYETTLTHTVCLDNDIFEEQTNPVCRNRGTYRFSGQGAPIVIREVEVTMIPEGLSRDGQASLPIELPDWVESSDDIPQDEQFRLRPRFEIELENRGRGNVFLQDGEQSIKDHCLQFSASESNRVYVQARLLTEELNCNNDNIVRLRNGKGSIMCELDGVIERSNNIEDQLTIDAFYMYRTQTDKEIELIRR